MKFYTGLLILTLMMGACGQRGDTPTPSAQGTSPADAVSPTSKTTDALTGVDISSYQGTVDFTAVKAAGATYLFAKATQGNTYADPDYPKNYAGARAAGLVVGAYHYFMTDDEPDSQFNNFTSVVTLTSGDLPPVVDIEALADNSLPNLTENLQQFLDSLEKHYGVKPIIYSGESFANEDLTGFGSYPLWLAEYGVSQPTLPNGWTAWTFWQWSQSGTIAGIDGAVDMDRFYGTEADLKKLLLP